MRLEELSEEHATAFLDMIADYQAGDMYEYEKQYARKTPWGPAEFRKYLSERQKERLDWRPPAGKTSVSRYVLLGESDKILANVVMRFPLDENTEIDGGNLLCDVPPSLRKQGYGSYGLALSLFEAVRAGLRRVLVTCTEGDMASRKIIERNRGVLQDVVESKTVGRKGTKICRYWISFG
jgi:predicted acetyltransferase